MSNDLLKQIDDLVASKTFNLDALDGIKQLKDDLQKQINETEWMAKKLKDETARCEELAKANTWQGNKIAALEKSIKENEETVIKGRDAIHEAAKHKAVADAWQGAMAMVFKPNAVRESVQRNHTVVVPNGSGSGYTTAVQNQDFVTREDA
jgi:chromosome segregation ATPase